MVDRMLPEGWAPSDSDCICGWARQNYHHAGNSRLRKIITANAAAYLTAENKAEKSKVISDIIELLRNESPTKVGLVRIDKDSGRWMRIGDDKAKDKIGHALRKASARHQKQSQSKVAVRSAAALSRQSSGSSAPEEAAQTPAGIHYLPENMIQTTVSFGSGRDEQHQHREVEDPSPIGWQGYFRPTLSPVRSGHAEEIGTANEQKEPPPQGHVDHNGIHPYQHPVHPPIPPPWAYHPAYHHPAYYGYHQGYSPYMYHGYGPPHPESSGQEQDRSGGAAPQSEI